MYIYHFCLTVLCITAMYQPNSCKQQLFLLLNVKQGTLVIRTSCSKNVELCLLEIIEVYLDTHDHQFGLKNKTQQICAYLC